MYEQTTGERQMGVVGDYAAQQRSSGGVGHEVLGPILVLLAVFAPFVFWSRLPGWARKAVVAAWVGFPTLLVLWWIVLFQTSNV